MDIAAVMEDFQEISKNIMEAQEKFQGKIEDIKSTMDEIKNNVQGKSEAFLKIQLGKLQNKLDKVIETVKKWIDDKKKAIQDWLDGIKEEIQKQLERMLTTILNALI